MYKLFLCLRYLRSRVIAYFAVLGVALCVAMVLIVISVMNGFLNKIESAAKGLFGHVTISASGLGGLNRYDKLAEELKQKVPEIQAVTPFISTYGLLRVPGFDYRKDVQVVGIQLSDSGRQGGATDCYGEVSAFAGGLFVQRGRWPSFDPPMSDVLDRLADDSQFRKELAAEHEGDSELQVSAHTALVFHSEALRAIRDREYVEKKLEDLQQLKHRLDEAIAGQRGAEKPADLRAGLERELTELGTTNRGYEEFHELHEELWRQTWLDGKSDLGTLSDFLTRAVNTLELKLFEAPDRRAIIGVGIHGLVYRTQQGQTIRKIVPGNKIVLTVVPLGRKKVGSAGITPVTANFTVIDDCRTDVWTVDSTHVYLPFETLQVLNEMDSPPRCSQLLVKVKDPYAEGDKLRAVCGEIRGVIQDFRMRHPDMTDSGDVPNVEPWMERLADVIGPLEKNRTLSVTMFGIISLVSVLLIFVIFYMIVVQKTRDIGVLKAIGASSSGVAGIFLAYGAAIGLVGSIIGTVGGYYFVRYINEIQDAIDRWWGWRVWDKKSFLFEKIPNEVNSEAAVAIIIGAVIAGLMGAIIPAVRAARMQPVEALRYE